MPPQAIVAKSVPAPPQLESKEREITAKGLTTKDFRPIKSLGRGDIGTVFLVALRSNDQPYAMKVICKEALRRKGEKRAETEKRVLSMVDHPFLPTLHAHIESEDHVFFVTSYCPGEDLNVLRQRQPLKKFSVASTRFYAAEVILALEHLHKLGIIYRDLKPENILIQSSGHLMVTDFDLSLIVDTPPVESDKIWKGLGSLKNAFSCISSTLLSRRKPGTFNPTSSRSKGNPGIGWASGRKHETFNLVSSQMKGNNYSNVNVLSRVWPTEPKPKKGSLSTYRSHSFVGTEEYVAPEVLWGNGHGFSVDWWTLGVFLYEMVYGRTPFKGPNRKETFFNILCKEPELPEPSSPLNDLIQKLLVKEPDRRLGSLLGAEEIKNHQFFHGLMWMSLLDMPSPPFVPQPFVLEDIEKDQLQKGDLTKDGRSSKDQLTQQSEEIQIQSTSETQSKELLIQKSGLHKIIVKTDSSTQQSDNSNIITSGGVTDLEVNLNTCVEKIIFSQQEDWDTDRTLHDNIGTKNDGQPFRDSKMLCAAEEEMSACRRSGTEELFSVF